MRESGRPAACVLCEEGVPFLTETSPPQAAACPTGPCAGQPGPVCPRGEDGRTEAVLWRAQS